MSSRSRIQQAAGAGCKQQPAVAAGASAAAAAAAEERRATAVAAAVGMSYFLSFILSKISYFNIFKPLQYVTGALEWGVIYT